MRNQSATGVNAAAPVDADKSREDFAMEERRLCDRVLHALELALEQEHLEVALHLASALELTLTDFGGPDKKERRDLPPEVADALDRLDALKHKVYAPPSVG